MAVIIHVADVVVSEADGFVDFVFTLSEPAALPVSVNWATGSGSASASSDFTGANGTVNFAVGETVKTVRLNLVGNATPEWIESGYLNLSAPVNALLGRTQALLTIVDNDGAAGTPGLSIGDVVVDESAGTASFVVRLDRPSTGPVSVNWATSNGNAVAGADYTAGSGALSFAAGETVKTVTVAINDDGSAEGDELFSVQLSGAAGATLTDATGIARIGASDRAASAAPLIRVADAVAGEGDGYVDFVFTLSAPSAATVSVNWSLVSGTASSASDFGGSSGTVTFDAGETTRTVRVDVRQDVAAEAYEFGTLVLSAPINGVLDRTQATLTIVDNDAAIGLPGVSVRDVVVDEAAGVATFVVVLDRPATGAVSVAYGTVDGNAVAGADYVAASGTLGFAPGETVKSVTVVINNDGAAEGDELFSLQLSAPSGATLVDASGTARIGSSDQPAGTTPMVRVADVVAGESDGWADVVFTLSAPSSQPVSVSWATSSGSASSATDFDGASGTVRFEVGETTKTVRIAVTDDAAVEALESGNITLSAPVNAVLDRTQALLNIVDDDAAPGTPGLSVRDVVVDEAAGVASFIVRLDRASTGAVNVAYNTVNGTANAGSDYVAASGTLGFLAGETVKTVTVALRDDAAAESAETFGLQLSAAVGATLIDAQGIARIGASDQPLAAAPLVRVTDAVAGEADGWAQFEFTLSAPSAQPVSVNWALSSGTASSATDFGGSSGTVRFAAGETTKTVRVAVHNDATAEFQESGRMLLSAPVNAVLSRTQALLTIVDNDAALGTPGLSVGDVVVDESAGVATFVVKLDRPSSGPVTVNYATADLNAVAGSDYVAASGTLGFAAGETVKTVSVLLNDDATAEGVEMFRLQLSAPGGATLIDGSGVARVGASDQAAVAAPLVRVADAVAGEGDGWVEFVLTLSAPSALPVSVNWVASSGSASSATDFGGSSGTVTFGAGETTQVLRVLLDADAAVEAIESGFLTLSAPVNAALDRTQALLTIVDNDTVGGVPGVSVSDAVVDESAGVATFVVKLDRATTGTVTVDYATGGGNAVAGSDYLAASGSVSFAAGEVVKTVSVVITNDSAGEAAESIGLKLSAAVGATIVDADGVARIGLSDRAAVALPVISVTDRIVSEADGWADVVFTLDAPSANAVSVNWQASSSTASAVTDFSGSSGTVRFAAGETTKVVRVALVNDGAAEATEVGLINLSAAVNATLARTQAQLRIVDNDGAVKVMSYGISDDTYQVGAGTDVIVENLDGGTDTVVATATYVLPDNVEQIVLVGGANLNATGNTLKNVLTGNAGDNRLDGKGGADTMEGGLGNDTYVVAGPDVVIEAAGGGTDTVRTGGNYVLPDQVEVLVITGTAGSSGTGNGLNNRLTGNAAGNTLDGAGGNDTLIGGLGNDTLLGGAGADTFLFNSVLNGSTNVDVLADFASVDDRLQLDDAVFAGIGPVGALAAGAFVVGAAATTATHRVVFDPTTGRLSFDADGDGAGAAVLFATVQPGTAVNLNDLFVV